MLAFYGELILDASWKVVKQGVWHYDGIMLCDVRILEHDWFYGSGDYEDAPELSDDREGTFYYVEFGSATERGKYHSRCGGYESLNVAVEAATFSTNNTVI